MARRFLVAFGLRGALATVSPRQSAGYVRSAGFPGRPTIVTSLA